MAGIFISYRRNDSAGSAGRLYEDLRRWFPHEAIFFDVDGIGPGEDYRKTIDERIASCDLLLAIIGPDWIKVQDAHGVRRLDDPTDFVRLEISAGLKRSITVIPVRVEGAAVPDAEALPGELQPLAYLQAVELRHEHWRRDVDDFLAQLEQRFGWSRSDSVERRERAANPKTRGWRRALIGGVLLLLVGIPAAFGGYRFYCGRQADTLLTDGITAQYAAEPNLERARNSYLRSLEWQPDLAPAAYHLAHVYAHLNAPDEALIRFGQALRIKRGLDAIQLRDAEQQIAALSQPSQSVVVAAVRPPPLIPGGILARPIPAPSPVKRGGFPYVPPDQAAAARIESLVKQMFAADRDARVAAVTTLILDPTAVSDAIPLALQIAMRMQEDVDNPNIRSVAESGVVNTFVLLRSASSIGVKRYDQEIRQLIAEARNNGQETAKIAAEVGRKIDAAAGKRPVAWIHIANESQRAIATALMESLATADYETPGIENVGDKAPAKRIEVRSHGASDQALARWQAKKIGDLIGDEVAITTLRKANPAVDSYEIWFDRELCVSRPDPRCT